MDEPRRLEPLAEQKRSPFAHQKFLRFFPGGFADETYIDCAAAEYGYDFRYRSRPNWDTYASLLEFAETVRRDAICGLET